MGLDANVHSSSTGACESYPYTKTCGSYSNTHTGSDKYTNSDIHSNTHTGSDEYTDSDTHSNTYAGSDEYADSDIHSNTHTDTHKHSYGYVHTYSTSPRCCL